MTRILLALAIFALPARAADCAACTASKLCAPHVESDKEACKALQTGLANADPAVRKSAIDMFAEACSAHLNCRPASNAALLGAALKDTDPAVRIRAAGQLGLTQDPRTTVKLLNPFIDPLGKRLDKEPKPGKDEVAWDHDFDFMKAIIVALAATGVPEAGPPMVRILGCARLIVTEAAAQECHRVRSREVPPAILERFDEVKKTPPETYRDRAYMALVAAWEKLTTSGVPPPAANSAGEANRWLSDCKAWWKANEKKFK
ncbi:MAG: hypothetical protein AAB074_14055 [Planctomycetota bacterium]